MPVSSPGQISRNKTSATNLQIMQEWIELQSHLINIYHAYEPFAVLLEHASSQSAPLDKNTCWQLWQPISKASCDLLDWAQQISFLGVRFKVNADSEENLCHGEKWAVDIERMRRDFHTLFETRKPKTKSAINFFSQKKLFRQVRYYLSLDVSWWDELMELTRFYRQILLSHIHITQTAIQDFSNQLYNEHPSP